ncbi:MAG: flagellar motor protein MotB [Verrucomicrobia bacterium]|nr:flagellar motor protein MotB [Verrucomicrobiota bacterium]MBR4248897.1 flagellar motor protein MotB [Verrucomicrobiota bacterium]
MKQNLFQILFAALAAAVFTAGCASDPNIMGVTNPRQPGPAAGRTAGAAVGGVVGNTAGFVAGFGEGAAAATSEVFNNRTYVVRQWQTVTTADGRVVQVPVDVVVDENGIPLQSVHIPADKASGNSVEPLSGKAREMQK